MSKHGLRRWCASIASRMNASWHRLCEGIPASWRTLPRWPARRTDISSYRSKGSGAAGGLPPATED